MREARSLTYADFLTLPDDGCRYEVLTGTVVKEPPPSTPHQAVVRQLFFALGEQLDAAGRRGLFVAPIGVVLAEDTVVQPDVLYVRPERLRIVHPDAIHGTPDLVAEVASPSTRRRDLGIKRDLYARHGVPEYWVVDPDGRRVYAFGVPLEGRYESMVVLHPGGELVSRAVGVALPVRVLFDAYR